MEHVEPENSEWLNVAVHAPKETLLPENRLFPVAGIGASAGGLEAFTRFLSCLPADTGMGFVLVQHLLADQKSMLAELLGRATNLPVAEIREGMEVEANHVYVSPPSANVAIIKGILHLTPRLPPGRHPLPINYFFTSLAEDRGTKAIGVILSGTASDGTQGLKVIKANGGLTFAQDGSASYDSMPQSAIAAGYADFVLPPEEIAKELAKSGRHPLMAPGNASEVENPLAPAPDDLSRPLFLLRKAKGVDFSLYKKAIVGRRITRRMVLRNIDNLANYHRCLQQDRAELDSLCQDLLFHVASFVPAATLELLKREVFPKLMINRPAATPFRIWVPACSTGQEAYSLAICALEFLAETNDSGKVQVFATDTSDTALEKARKGKYAEADVSGMDTGWLKRWFINTAGTYEIRKSIRDMCVFAKQDVLKDPPLARLDLISCRALLTYLDASVQKKVVRTFHYALRPNGFLILGKWENPGEFSNLFTRVDKKSQIYWKKTTTVESALRSHEDSHRKPGSELADQEQVRWSEIRDFSQQLEQTEQLHNITDSYDVAKEELYAANEELRATNEDLQSANEELQSMYQERQAAEDELRATNEQLETLNKELQARNAELANIISNVAFPMVILGSDLRIRRFTRSAEKLFNLIGSDVGRPITNLRSASDFPGLEGAVSEAIATSNTQEREVLDSLGRWYSLRVRPYKTTENQIDGAVLTLVDVSELKSQATEARFYAEAIVETVREPLLVLDDELRVKAANRAFFEMFQVAPEETEGQSLERLGNGQWNIPPLLMMLRRILQQHAELKGYEVEHDFPKLGRRTMLLNARQIQRDRRSTELILLSIEDVTERKQAMQTVEKQSRLIGLAHDAIIVRDPEDAVTLWNHGAEILYGWTREEALGKVTHELLKTKFPEPREEIQRTLMTQGAWAGELIHTARNGTEIVVTSRQVLERDAQGQPAAILEINRDMTQRKQAEEWVRASEARLRALVSSMDDAVFEIDEQGTCLNVWTANQGLLVRPKAELIGRHIGEFLSAEAARSIAEACERVLNTRRSESVEYVLDMPEGRRWFVGRVSQIAFAQGPRKTLSLLVHDVTVHKEAELALQQSEERFRLLVEGVKDYAIYMLDPQGRVTTWNAGAERIKGYRAEEILGKHFSSFYPREDVEAGKPARALEIAAREGRFEEEGWRVRGDGSRFWVNAVITVLRDQEGNLRGFAKVTRDTTERKESERAVRQLSARILRVQDEERRRIARELHDSTAQVLSGLALNLALIEQRGSVADDPRASRALAECQQLADQAASEVRNLSHLLHPPDLDAVGLVAAVRWFSSKFSERTGIRIEADFPDKLRRLPPDVEIALFRVVQEALSNVQRHSGSPVARIRIAEQRKQVKVAIEDDGKGVSAEVLASRNEGSTRSLGVGIAGMRERLQQLGGRLEITAKAPGTILTATVPVVAEAENRRRATRRKALGTGG